MKRSEFDIAVADEFGESYGRVLVNDLALSALGGRTAREGIRDGVEVRSVWLALCDETDVPVSRRAGVGRPEPRS
ncbi:Protein of unknown function (DUF3046) [Labedella gwakjiensis]|uniref:DUF3046 domain-containing protein n=1 Tax=Labedella gwakjiensis TaxID=390269 RepID=A0A2P8GYJ6_9MICO|nr:DUF3046 domain-containing protein [Labedella gwakjiensis]PSL39048.1 Protein of unknown function (DUF3046) [Labedella gwakjiensis]RUQ86503.1 DUF3046 domain-containing protein [Labedella gwakjiensis]